MKFKELVLKTRSCRRFKQSPISRETLVELVDIARLSPSGANLQALKYFISCDSDTNDKIFPNTQWAGYFKDWSGPSKEERPTGYILILLDKKVAASSGCDHGIAAEAIVLAACEIGLASCMIGSVSRKELSESIDLDDNFQIMLVIALGEQGEEIVLEDMSEKDGSIRYYRDENEHHHVPKRKLDDVLIN